MKQISILLTRYTDPISEVVDLCSGRHGYTHVSLALEADGVFYSFNFRGFCVETLEKHRRRGVCRSVSYELLVTDRAHAALRRRIDYFLAHQTRKIRTYFRLEKGSGFSFSSGTTMKAPVDGVKLRYLVIDRKTITRFGGYDYEVR